MKFIKKIKDALLKKLMITFSKKELALMIIGMTFKRIICKGLLLISVVMFGGIIVYYYY